MQEAKRNMADPDVLKLAGKYHLRCRHKNGTHSWTPLMFNLDDRKMFARWDPHTLKESAGTMARMEACNGHQCAHTMHGRFYGLEMHPAIEKKSFACTAPWASRNIQDILSTGNVTEAQLENAGNVGGLQAFVNVGLRMEEEGARAAATSFPGDLLGLTFWKRFPHDLEVAHRAQIDGIEYLAAHGWALRVEYDDGDWEHITLQDVLAYLDSPAMQYPPGPGGAATWHDLYAALLRLHTAHDEGYTPMAPTPAPPPPSPPRTSPPQPVTVKILRLSALEWEDETQVVAAFGSSLGRPNTCVLLHDESLKWEWRWRTLLDGVNREAIQPTNGSEAEQDARAKHQAAHLSDRNPHVRTIVVVFSQRL
jgi:hypothetical protein